MAIKDFRWAMSFWCCQNNAAFHELLETSNRWLIKIFGGKLVLVVAPTPPFPHELLETTNRRLLRFWAGQGNFEELPANDTCWPALISKRHLKKPFAGMAGSSNTRTPKSHRIATNFNSSGFQNKTPVATCLLLTLTGSAKPGPRKVLDG